MPAVSRASLAVPVWRGTPSPSPPPLTVLPRRRVLQGGGTHEFSNAREGMKSPLAKKLFTVDGVASVFFGSDFITVSKKDDYNWAVLKPDIFAAIMDFYTSGEALFQDADALARSDTAIHPDDSEVGRRRPGSCGPAVCFSPHACI